MRRPLAVFLGFSSLHFAIQFFAWACAPGNTARSDAAIRWMWPALSFPAFYVIPSPLATAAFWQVCILNSAIWGAALALFLAAKESRGSEKRAR